MTYAAQGRSLPVNFAAYPATVEHVDGFVITIDGRGGFIDHVQARAFGLYLARQDEPITEPVEIRQSIAPQSRRP